MLVPTPLPPTEVKKASRALQTPTIQDSLSSFKFLNFSGWLDLQLAAQKRASLKFAGNDNASLPRSKRLNHSKSLPTLTSSVSSNPTVQQQQQQQRSRVVAAVGSGSSPFAGKWINRGVGIEEFYTPHVSKYRLLQDNNTGYGGQL